MLGLSSGSVLAHDDHPEKALPPHERPAPAHPAGGPSGGNLAEAATNPIANLVQFQLQNVFNGDNHNSDGSNPENNAGPTPTWTLKFNVTLLFPE